MLKTKCHRLGFRTHYHYKGSYDCLKRICQDEGFFALYKGFVPSYIRSVFSLKIFNDHYEFKLK